MPLRDLDLVAWRRAIAVIFQDFVRYEVSAQDNIGFGSIPLLETAAPEHLNRSSAVPHNAPTP